MIIENTPMLNQDRIYSYLAKHNPNNIWEALYLGVVRTFVIMNDNIIGVMHIYPANDNTLAVAVAMDKHTLDKNILKEGLDLIKKMELYYNLSFSFNTERKGWTKFVSSKLCPSEVTHYGL